MALNLAYVVNEEDLYAASRRSAIIREMNEKVYSYDEAINLTGSGKYSLKLLGALSLCVLSMGTDIFGASVVIPGAACDLKLDISQTSIIFSMSFIGPIVMAYPWGYISDTQGRKRSLLISLWTSFAVSTLSAFSPNWIVLAVLKFISTSFCSCAQSVTYALLGECCPDRARDSYMLVMTSVLDFSLAIYVGIAYFILNMDFSYNLIFITFTPWRLLVIALALPLGFGALSLHYFCESPKFLVNEGKTKEALKGLRRIWRENGGKKDEYPVKKIYLDEEGNKRSKNTALVQSLYEQVLPLFKPPLLWRSLQLYFITAVVYGTNNSYFIWFPILADKFIKGLNSDSTEAKNPGLCNLIVDSYANSTTPENVDCSAKLDINLVWSSVAQGVTFVVVLLCISKIAYRKRMLMMTILFVSCISGVGAVIINENITNFIMFFGLLLNELCIGILFSYFVDLYPTSYRGMAACLGVMVARTSALAGVNLLGAFLMTHCSMTFYFCSCIIFSAVVISWLLPPDKPRK